MELSVQLVDTGFGADHIELLVEVYHKQSLDSVPEIEKLYKEYAYRWEEDSIEYLFANKDAFQLESNDFINIDEHLEVYGFKVPAFQDVHRWMDVLQLMYATDKGEVIHSPVMSVW